jgi:PadR family transcriptional regulator
MRAYDITLHVQRVSKDALRAEEGSLYPAPRRMEQDGLIAAEWGHAENNRRARYYPLTAKGRKKLTIEEKKCSKLPQAVSEVLRFA